MVKEHEKEQKPIYYINKTLILAKTRYSHLEKAVLAMVTTIRKLWPYFEVHTVGVITYLSLKGALFQPDITERMMKWASELGNLDIRFILKTTIPQ